MKRTYDLKPNPWIKPLALVTLFLTGTAFATEPVTVANFVRAESDHMIRQNLAAFDASVGKLFHIRAPTTPAPDPAGAAALAARSNVDKLANIIREVDGNHSLGAGALAEAIIQRWADWGPQPPALLSEDEDGQPVGYSNWYNDRFRGQTVDTSRDHHCEAAWRRALEWAASEGGPPEGTSANQPG